MSNEIEPKCEFAGNLVTVMRLAPETVTLTPKDISPGRLGFPSVSSSLLIVKKPIMNWPSSDNLHDTKC